MFSKIRISLTILICAGVISCTQEEAEPEGDPYSGLETIASLDNYPARLGIYEDYDNTAESNDVEFYLRLMDHPEFGNIVIPDTDTSLIKILFFQSFDHSYLEEEVEQYYDIFISNSKDSPLDFEFYALTNFQQLFLSEGSYEDRMVFNVSGEIKKRSDDVYQNLLDAHPFVPSMIKKQVECQVDSDDRGVLNGLELNQEYRLEKISYRGEFYFPTCEKNNYELVFSTDSVASEYYEDGEDWRLLNIPYWECKKELYYQEEEKIYVKSYALTCTFEDRPFTRDELLFDEKVQEIFSYEMLDFQFEDNYLLLNNPITGDQLFLFSEE